MSSTPLENITQTDTNYHWFQLYFMKDAGVTKSLVQRAERAGCKAIVITVDMPFMAVRLRDLRECFIMPENIKLANLSEDILDQSDKPLKDDLFCKNISWNMIGDVCKSTKLPVYLKGIFDYKDALFALDYGVAGLIISNHGGRQLDGTINPLDSLRMLFEKNTTLNIGIDGGIRSGRDIFVALSLGADFVLIGRPIYWALASGGVEHVKNLIMLIKNQLREVMHLSGVCSISDARIGDQHFVKNSCRKNYSCE